MNRRNLKEVSDLITKGTTPSSLGCEFVNEGINFIKSESISDSKFLNNSIYEHIDEETNNKLKRSSLKENDLLFSIAGAYLGKMAIVQAHDLPANTNQAVGIVRLKKDKVDVDYIYYYFSQKSINSFINKLSSQSSQPNLNLDLLGKLEFEDKDLLTQKSIAKVLSALDAKIELNNRINAELEAMAKTLYDYWFVQFDFPYSPPTEGCPQDGVGIGKPYKTSGGKMVWNGELKREIPEGWEVKKLSEIATTGSGGTPLSTKKEFYENGNIPWINSGEVNMPFIVSTKNYITQKGLENSSAKMFKRGTILMAMYGATAGKVSFMDIEACTNQAICAINPKEDFYRIYIKLVLEDLYKYLINLSTGSARDNLSQDKIRELKFIIPSKSLIQKFDEMVQSSMDKILINLKENQHLASLRDWLLPMLMNGQVTVRQAHGIVEKEAEKVDFKEEEAMCVAAEPVEKYTPKGNEH